MLHVVAFLTAQPGKRDELLAIFNANVPAVLAEKGCIDYGAAIDTAGAAPAFGPDVLVAIEKWEDHAALQAHGAAEHMKAFRNNIAGIIADVAVHVLDPAG